MATVPGRTAPDRSAPTSRDADRPAAVAGHVTLVRTLPAEAAPIPAAVLES
jgi:hypothetical protein